MDKGQNVTDIDAYTYYVSLRTRVNATAAPDYCAINPQYTHVCAGGLIGSRIVLTAAHCLLNGTFIHSYRIAPHYKYSLPSDRFPAYRIKKYLVHPNFSLDVAPYSAYDLAVILLDQNVSDKHAILKLPEQPLYEHQEVKMLSFGADSGDVFPNVMQEAKLVVNSDDMCEENLTWASFSRVNNICVSNAEGSVGCPTDSGAPLVWEGEGTTFIVGVLSIGKCRQSKFTVFVHVQPNVPFIKKAMEELLA